MKEIVWKFGEKPDKSYKKINTNLNDDFNDDFNDDLNTNKNIHLNTLESDIIVNHNKREQVDIKLNERMLMCQCNKNPYFAKSSYLEDLKTQDEFLKPQLSNI